MWVLKTGRVTVNETTLKFPNTFVLLAILAYLSFERTGDLAIREGLRKRNLKRGKGNNESICVRAVLWITD